MKLHASDTMTISLFRIRGYVVGLINIVVINVFIYATANEADAYMF